MESSAIRWWLCAIVLASLTTSLPNSNFTRKLDSVEVPIEEYREADQRQLQQSTRGKANFLVTVHVYNVLRVFVCVDVCVIGYVCIKVYSMRCANARVLKRLCSMFVLSVCPHPSMFAVKTLGILRY